MEYRIYLRHQDKKYYCNKCNKISREKTMFENFGLYFYTQSKNYNEKHR